MWSIGALPFSKGSLMMYFPYLVSAIDVASSMFSEPEYSQCAIRAGMKSNRLSLTSDLPSRNPRLAR
jgi:hypothetical protein